MSSASYGLPAGFRYQAQLIDRAEERRLVEEMERLESSDEDNPK
jgi:hypothetical protein